MAANSHSLDLELSSSQNATAADSASLSITGNLTIALWIKQETTLSGGGLSVLLSKDNGTNQRAYGIALEDAGGTTKVDAFMSGDGTSSNMKQVQIAPNTALGSGAWHHLVITMKPATAVATAFELFQNGTSAGNGSDNGSAGTVSSIADTTALTGIGARADGFFYYDGLIDEILVTSDILSQAEITKLYQGYVPTDFLDNIKAYWPLNNSYNDSSGNNNTLTPVNSPVFSSTVPFANYIDVAQASYFFTSY